MGNNLDNVTNRDELSKNQLTNKVKRAKIYIVKDIAVHS